MPAQKSEDNVRWMTDYQGKPPTVWGGLDTEGLPPHTGGSGGPPDMSLDGRVSTLEEKMGHIPTKFEVGTMILSAALAFGGAIGIYMDSRFDSVSAQFSGVDTKFESVAQRFDGLDKRFDGIDKRLDGIDTRMDRIESNLDQFGNKLDDMQSTLGEISRKLDK